MVVYSDDGHILLGRERDGWSCFVGKMEYGETPLQTATREFREETCDCFPVPPLSYEDCIVSRSPRGKQVYLFFCSLPREDNGSLHTRFSLSASTTTDPCKLEKFQLKWFTYNDTTSIKIRPCFQRDFPTVLHALTERPRGRIT